MKAQLILLDNPIVVTDEEIKEGEMYIVISGIGFPLNSIHVAEKEGYNNSHCKKVINKPIDYNGIDFGIVDVEKLAKEKYPCWSGEWEDGFLFEGFIEGFKASQQLNEKKFSEEDAVTLMIQVAKYIDTKEMKDLSERYYDQWCIKRDWFINHTMEKSSLPKTFDIEIEETPTNIKIIKKL